MKGHNMIPYAKIFFDLLREDFVFFKQKIADKIINAVFWVVPTTTVAHHILPCLGLPKTFGVFLAMGTIAACGFFETIKQMTLVLKDFENENKTSYYLTLPLPNWLLWIRTGLYFTANSLFISVASFLACKAILWNHLNFQTINYLELITALIAVNFFSGFFTLFLISITKNVDTIRNTTMRLLYPLWILGAFYYSWKEINTCYPWLGNLLLFNPYTYATEAIRAAVLGHHGYLPFWYCIGALTLFGIFFALFGITKLRQRLDSV